MAKDKVQRELDGATHNEKVFQVLELMVYSEKSVGRIFEKQSIKDHSSRNGTNRSNVVVLFIHMDVIYSHRPDLRATWGNRPQLSHNNV